MIHKPQHIRIRLFSCSDHENETNKVIENFEKLLLQNKVFDKQWGFVRIKAEGTKNSFYLGGGRMPLPKRQITFDNEAPPNEILSELNGDRIETEVQDWCSSADVFLFCIDINNKPEAEKIARLTWRIKQTYSEKTILYVITNCEEQGVFSTFDEYAKSSVTLNQKLSNGYFPYSSTAEFIKNRKEKFSVYKKLFCFGEETNTYSDCLLFCINQLYKDVAELKVTNNKAYHYLSTNINFKSNIMAESIKIAVVGAADNGKSHFISDVFRALNLMSINCSTKKFPDYAQVSHYLNEIVGKKEINPTDPLNRTRNGHHYKGELQGLNKCIEFMDIPGEAFMNANNLYGTYQNLKDVVTEYYTHSLFKQIFCKKKNTFFIEEYETSGKITKITLSLNKKIAVTKTPVQATSFEDLNQAAETPKVESKKIETNKTKYVSGKYVVENFKKYETENLKSVLKQIVEEQKNNESYPNLQNIDDEFWQNFYSYVFCDSCDDIILCELLALPKGTAQRTTSSKKKANLESDFKTCLEGIKTFFNKKKPRMYIIFRGLDAMINQNGNTFRNLYGGKVGNDIAQCSPYIYLLIHLAIYKKFMTQVSGVSANFNNLKKSIEDNQESGFLRNELLEHLIDNNGYLKQDLDKILLDESDFELPRDNSNQGIASHLSARISEVQNSVDTNRFQPLKDINTGELTNFILPHIYFTAYPIDAINLTIHKNSSTNRQAFENLNIHQRLPLGTFNFVADLLNANGITDYHKGSDLENLLYNNN